MSNSEQKSNQPRSQIAILLAGAAVIIGGALFFKYSQLGGRFLWNISDGGKWLLPLVGVSALVDSINPCAFSVLILTIAVLVSLGRLRSSIMKIGAVYIAGLYLVYFLIGLGLLHVLHLFNTPHFMAKLAAGVLITLGAVNLISEFWPSFPVKLRIPHLAHHRMAVLMDKASLPAAFSLGVLVGLCEFPCTGGPYLMILGLLHDTASYFQGVGYLVLYNAIFILPLVAILLVASHPTLLAKVRVWQQKERGLERLGGALAMIALGVLILLL